MPVSAFSSMRAGAVLATTLLVAACSFCPEKLLDQKESADRAVVARARSVGCGQEGSIIVTMRREGAWSETRLVDTRYAGAASLQWIANDRLKVTLVGIRMDTARHELQNAVRDSNGVKIEYYVEFGGQTAKVDA